jgi:MFS transporter, DHA1 family, inner membrane transport protein
MRKSLLALTAAAFGIGTTEFIIMGLLPQLATDFSISIPKAGALVSGYALSVTCGSPLVAVALGKIDRRRALLMLMSLFTVGNALCALAPGFGVLLGARILTALCHGSFFGIASVLAANIVPRGERAQAIALMFSGLTLANILGVPVGTALGLAFGWRAAFWALVPIGLLAIGLLVWLIPSQMPEPSHLMQELRAVLKPSVQIVLTLSTLSSIAMFCVLTYIAPILEFATHLSPHAVTWVLVIFGVGITIGNLLGGWLSDRRQMPVILGGMTLLILTFLLMPAAVPYRLPAIVAVFIWGFIHFAAAAPFQARIVEKAQSPNLASVLNQSAFNFGNALGASLGGLALTHGLSYRQLPYVSAAIASLALIAGLVAWRFDRTAVAQAV